MQKCDPKIQSIPAKHPPTGEHPWGLFLYVKRTLKNLNYKKLLLIVVKRSLLTLRNKTKMNGLAQKMLFYIS